MGLKPGQLLASKSILNSMAPNPKHCARHPPSKLLPRHYQTFFKQNTPKTQPSPVQKNWHYSNNMFSSYKCQHFFSYKRQFHLRLHSRASKKPFDCPVDFCCQEIALPLVGELLNWLSFFPFLKKENHQGFDFLFCCPLHGCPPWAQLAQRALSEQADGSTPFLHPIISTKTTTQG